jgi:hypothetical protein
MGEAMSLTTINVTQPHTLGVEEAIARLTKGEKSSLLKLTGVTATFELNSKFAPNLEVRVTIAPDRVTVESEQLPVIAQGPLDWLAENRIKAKLEELLK